MYRTLNRSFATVGSIFEYESFPFDVLYFYLRTPPPVPLCSPRLPLYFTRKHKNYFCLDVAGMQKKAKVYSIQSCEWGDTYIDLFKSLPLQWSATRLPDTSMVFSRDDQGAIVKVRVASILRVSGRRLCLSPSAPNIEVPKYVEDNILFA